MSSTTTAVQPNLLDFLKTPLGAGFAAGFSGVIAAINALAMKVFVLASPLGGAIFGGTFGLSVLLLNPLIDRVIEKTGMSEAARHLTSLVLSIIGSIVLGMATSTFAGLPVSLAAAGVGLASLVGTISVVAVGIGIYLHVGNRGWRF